LISHLRGFLCQLNFK